MRDPHRELAVPGRLLRRSFAFACLASLLLFSQREAAAGGITILTFTQNQAGSPVTLTNDGSGNGTITATDVKVLIGTLNNLPVLPAIPAFLSLSLTNTGPATVSGTSVSEAFSGTFSITSGTGGSGTNYLSGSFTDVFQGNIGASSGAVVASEPTSTVTFTSGVGLQLGSPRALALSFASISPALVVNGGSIGAVGSTTMSVSGVYSAVPEPSSLALGGIAVVVLIGCKRLRLRRRIPGRASGRS
jgi:hypothetical protein